MSACEVAYIVYGDTQSVWTMTDAGLLRVIPPARVRAALAAAAFREWQYHRHSQPSPRSQPDGGGYFVERRRNEPRGVACMAS